MNIRSLILAVFLTIFSYPAFLGAAESAKNESADEDFRGRPITLRDFGSDDLGFLSLPDIPPRYGVLLLHDSIGLDDRIKRRCDWIAERGDMALAVDLFNGHTAKTPEEALAFQKELRQESAFNTIHAALRLFEESPRLSAPKVIVVSMGKQCALTLPALRKHSQRIIGISWIEPEGAFNEKLFERSRFPIQVISKYPNSIVSLIRKNLDSERKNLTFLIQTSPAPSDNDEAWNRAFVFWRECAIGKWKPQNLFDQLFD